MLGRQSETLFDEYTYKSIIIGLVKVEDYRMKQSGRRQGYPRRPPTPPGIRFRTKAVPINALNLNLNACRTISTQPYLVDSVH